MARLKILIRSSLTLGVLSAFALVSEYMALADIAKNPNSPFEWHIVGICMLIIVAFIATGGITLFKLLQMTNSEMRLPQQTDAN